MNIVVTVLIVTPSVPPIYQTVLTIPNIALTTSIACRVYRNLYLEARGLLYHPPTIINESIHFATAQAAAAPPPPDHGGDISSVTGAYGVELEAVNETKNSPLEQRT
ncbi:hypothetical protein J3R30DRAFT_3454431 [Lentinula aciculospora]|uniref:Uncharacterized protein n=1 Tax=Lentinula aciculospora TaxID=153920 RepID=A0A9W9AG92_9AGAR|nr:hypothetical protein J3R30DRAFT_3454431 [Lentinula aciculospora]